MSHGGELAGNPNYHARRLGPIERVVAVGALLATAVGLNHKFDFGFPDILNHEGGHPQEAPQGVIQYQSQEAVGAATDLWLNLGYGYATVAGQASQRWDKHGSILNGDLQSTNGHDSLEDPNHKGQPALLHVRVQYCAAGTIAPTQQPDPVTHKLVTTSVAVNLGERFVCGATLPIAVENNSTGQDKQFAQENASAFKQDDTPNDVHGEFVAFVGSAVTAEAEAAPCPSDQLNRFASPQYIDTQQKAMAKRFSLPLEAVTMNAGTIGMSTDADKESLQHDLTSYANKTDPHDPTKTHPSLSITFNTAEGAVDKACFRKPNEVALKDIEAVGPQDIRQ